MEISPTRKERQISKNISFANQKDTYRDLMKALSLISPYLFDASLAEKKKLKWDLNLCMSFPWNGELLYEWHLTLEQYN